MNVFLPDGDADSGVDETESAQPEPDTRERREEAGAGARQRAATSRIPRCVDSSAPKSSIRRFVITEKAPTRAFS